MCRIALAALALVVAAALTAAARPAAAAVGTIDLRIAHRASETAPVRVYTLRCDPARGTVRAPASACRKLRAIGPKAFAPTPPDRACAQIFGGPQIAIVTGIYDGRRLWARLSRSDGCAIGRWNSLAFLFPVPGS